MFRLISEDSKTKARTGILHTAHGKLKTPFFMPVATKGAVKHVSQKELEDIGIRCTISNAMLLHLRPGSELIKKFGGLGKFMRWKHGTFTDSGGFQMLSPHLFIDINDKHVLFRDPYDGTKHSLTPEDVMEIELNIGADVAMCLDHVSHVNNTRKDIEIAMDRTHLWAARCKKEHDRLKKQMRSKQLLFGIAQGGTHKDLREKSARFIDSLDFDGIAMGGLCIGESREAMFNAIEYQIPLLNPEKPRYLMGVGSPEDIIEAISHGCDIFDSRYPTRNARHGTLFTSKGVVDLLKSRYKEMKGPIDEDCRCFVCRNFSAAYIHHLVKMQEALGMRYVSIHNIHFLNNLIEDCRKAIDRGYFSKFKKEFFRSYLKDKAKQKVFKQVYSK
jgi:queuine tRNA-ribosyltransferase